jgi:hypothetical protein
MHYLVPSSHSFQVPALDRSDTGESGGDLQQEEMNDGVGGDNGTFVFQSNIAYKADLERVGQEVETITTIIMKEISMRIYFRGCPGSEKVIGNLYYSTNI